MLRKIPAAAVLFVFFLVAGCGGGGTSATSAPPPSAAALSISPTGLSFSGVAAGSASAAQPVTLVNTGGATLTLQSIVLNDTSNYAMSSTCGASLTPGAGCTLSVTFTPQSAAMLNSSITITDDASNSPQTITLAGSSTTPTGPQAAFSPTSLTFASTDVNVASTAQTVVLSNPGTAELTGISFSIGGTGAAAFSQTTTCGTTLAVNASCSISVVFTPATAGSFDATLGVSDNAANSPQFVMLSGTGVSAPAPTATLSSSIIDFPTTAVNATSSAVSVTLSNSGTATLVIGSIALGGTDPGDFAETNTCGATLAVSASCTVSTTFTPTAAATDAATITIADNAANSPQVITLNGTGGTLTLTQTLYVFPAQYPETTEPDASVKALYALINNAQSTVDMTMYELEDTTFSGDLVADCARGVRVRVILDLSEKSSNAAAYAQLNGAGANCSAVYSNSAFTNTHQKTITVDDATTAILTLNLQTQYYTTTRDFALIENDPADIADIEATFAADYAAGTPSGGTQGASDFSYQPGGGDTTIYPNGDLIWSPTTATSDLLGIINGATTTLLAENEEMSASNIVSALVAACQRGVSVEIAMTNDDNEYSSEFSQLEAAGCGVHTGPDNSTALYIHAKAIVADYGLSTQQIYMGSINFSTASLTENRELGLYITDPTVAATIESTISSDYALYPSF